MSDNSFFVTFGGDTTQLQESAQQAKGILTELGDTLKTVFANHAAAVQQTESEWKKIEGVLAEVTLGLTTAAAAATAYLMKLGSDATTFGEAIKSAAGDQNQSVQTMSEMKALADRSGESLATLGASFLNIQTKAAAADDAMVHALAAIGMKAEDVAGLTESQLAGKMANAFANAAESSNKAATGAALFGSAWSSVAPILNRGKAAVDDLQAAAHRAGVVIGPEFASAISGTNELMQQFKDVMQEVEATFKGQMLQSFATFKPAIDTLVVAFADLGRNTASLIEWWNKLGGSAEKAAKSEGLLAEGANWFATAMVDAIAYSEEFGLKVTQYVETAAIAFKSLGSVVSAFANDLGAAVGHAAENLYNAFKISILATGQLFSDLAAAGSAALHFDVSGVKASLAQIQDLNEETVNSLRQHYVPFFGQTEAAYAQMRTEQQRQQDAIQGVINKIDAQRQSQLALLAVGGHAGRPPGSTPVGDPSVPAADKAGASRASQEAEADLKKQIADAKEAYDEIKQAADQALAEHKITMSQWAAQTKAALNSEADTVQDSYDKIMENAAVVKDKKVALAAEETNELRAIWQQQADAQKKLTEEMQRNFEQMATTITGAFTSQLKSLLAGTETVAAAMKNVAADLALKFIESSAESTAKWIADQLAQAAASQAGATAKIAADTSASAGGALAAIAGALKIITADAASVFGSVFAFLSPVLGPAAAGPAAVASGAVMAAGGAIASADIGMWSVPHDQLALVHHNELIMPAGPAGTFRDMLSNGGGGSGGGDVHLHFQPTINAIDAAGVQRFMNQYAPQLAKTVQQYQKLNPSTA